MKTETPTWADARADVRKPPTRLTAIAQALSSATSTSMCVMIRAYQLTLSPMLGERCRFYPSCSAYAMQALRQHGPLRGSVLSLRRLCKCHPWHPGGIDEVPARADEHAKPSTLQ